MVKKASYLIAPLCRKEQQPAEVRESGSEASKKQEAKPRSLLSFSKATLGRKGPQPEEHHKTLAAKQRLLGFCFMTMNAAGLLRKRLLLWCRSAAFVLV